MFYERLRESGLDGTVNCDRYGRTDFVIKNGNGERSKQYRCQACETYFIALTGTIFTNHKFPIGGFSSWSRSSAWSRPPSRDHPRYRCENHHSFLRQWLGKFRVIKCRLQRNYYLPGVPATPIQPRSLTVPPSVSFKMGFPRTKTGSGSRRCVRNCWRMPSAPVSTPRIDGTELKS